MLLVLLCLQQSPCADFAARQQCTLAFASYTLIASTLFWVLVVFMTQCMDPPLWAIELSAWKVQKRGSSRPALDVHLDADKDNADGRIARLYRSTLRNSKEEGKYQKRNPTKHVDLERRRRWWHSRGQVDPAKEGLIVDNKFKDNPQLAMESRFYDNSIDSALSGAKRQRGEGQSLRSSGSLDSVIQLAEKGQLPESSGHRPNKFGGREVNTFKSITSTSSEMNNILKDDECFTIIGEFPPQDQLESTSTEKVAKKGQFVSTALTKKASVSQITARNSNKYGRESKANDEASPQDILRDLVGSEVKNDNKELKNDERSSARLNNGGRTFKKKISGNAKKRRRKVRRRAKNGYALIDDEDDDEYEQSRSSPPIEVRIGVMDRNGVGSRVYTADEETLMDNWNALHAATIAGAATAVKEDAQSLDPPGKSVAMFDEENSQFVESDSRSSHGENSNVSPLMLRDELSNFSDVSFSDPEPVYYSSDETKSEVSISSLERFVSEKFKDEDDDSTLSGASGSSGSESGSRRNSRGRRRRRRRGTSSVCSIRSARSLLDLTIDEETDQDILNEEAGLGAYEFKRTLSAPEQRSGKHRSNRRQLGCNGTSMSDRSMDNEVCDPGEDDDNQENLSRVGNRRGRSVSIPRASKKVQNRISLSPSRVRNAKISLWKDDRSFDGGIHARVAVVSDDSSHSNSSKSLKSNKSERARRARIRRLQRGRSCEPGPKGGKLKDWSPDRCDVSSTLVDNPVLGIDDSPVSLKAPISRSMHAEAQRAEEELSNLSYNELMIDSLDLQLIECRRPQGAEYGDDEASL